jgi:methylmalonyl-CoA mutase cobalamin-binding domain/chain
LEPLDNQLRAIGNILAGRIVELQYARQPQVWKPFGHPGRAKSIRDAGYHLAYLSEALEADSPELFIEYLAWVKVLFAGLKFPESALPATLDCTRQALVEELSPEAAGPALAILELGMTSLDHAPLTLPGFIEGVSQLDQLARQYLDHLLGGNRNAASHLILEAVHHGVGVKEIYSQVFERTQREIGRLWQTNQVSVAQEHFTTAATQMIMSQLYPFIFTGIRKDRRMVMACVGGELHEIGARMVADYFEMEGWDTYFLGANTPPESIIKVVQERNADVLALSATMAFHVSNVTAIIRDLHAGKPSKTRVLVGGYPFNLSPDLWIKIGADGYAPDAKMAILEAERTLNA